MAVSQLTADQFDHVLASHELLLIDFSAEWCGPCKNFAKVMEAVSKEYPDCFFATIDVDKEKSLAQEFVVQSVPSILIIRNRRVIFAESGALSANELRKLLDDAKVLQT
ncbi:MAG: thioredoxin [uncultured bacterium]|nr:MAG: thioredoxin [uncultured bacterium]